MNLLVTTQTANHISRIELLPPITNQHVSLLDPNESLAAPPLQQQEKVAAYKDTRPVAAALPPEPTPSPSEEDLHASPPPVYFATENSTVVTAQTGSTALVPCIVKNIGDGMVTI
ncbi:hypothetical protein B566_EDAN001956 [Ephemera danica]|nr:hypothetical protein B566_EDAN001956 [Ephemera danica]